MSVHVERLTQAPGLGRHVRHDSRSLAYAVGVLPKSAIVSQHWQRRVPIFDQGQLGSCTGNAAAGWLGTDDATRQGLTAVPTAAGLTPANAYIASRLLASGDTVPVDEALAVSIYSDATKIDDAQGSYPPDDTGSDGISVASVLKSRGLAASYTHAFSIDAVYSALQTGPGLLGIPWYNSMFDTDATGHISVKSSSGVAGGHEIIVPRIDVTNGVVERIWIDNSWGTSWGVSGSAWFTPAELTHLLADSGDFTVPNAVAVTPTPQPTPGPGAASFQLDSVVEPHVAMAAKRAGLSEQDWLTKHLHGYFHV